MSKENNEQTQGVPAGYMLVPVEPTPEMDRAAFEACEVDGKSNGFANGTEARREIYSAMPELKSDAEAGAGACASAIRARGNK